MSHRYLLHISNRPILEKRVKMNVDCAYNEKTQGSGLDPLLIQIDTPTREYIPPIHSAHVKVQMLLELHSKINIFTQKKGINNLGKKKSLQIQSSYYSALVLSLHCTSLSIIVLSQPHPACRSHKGTSNCLPDSECHTMSFTKGKVLLPGGIWKHVPYSDWDVEITHRLTFFPAGTSLCKNKTQGNLNS